MAARELDVRGLSCPLPILRTRKALDVLAEGEELVVFTTDPASVIDFRHFCNTTSNELVAHGPTDDGFMFRIRKGAGLPSS